MRRDVLLATMALVLIGAARGQEPRPVPEVPAPPLPPAAPAPPRPALGKWWKNSQIVRELELKEDQVKQLEEAFLVSRKTLSELNANLSSQEAQLQTLLDADQIDEARLKEQTERVLSTRGLMERANTAMMLSFRRILTSEQWKKLDLSYRSSGGLAALPPKPPAPPAPAKSAHAARPAAVKQVGKTAQGETIYAISDEVTAPVLVQQPLPGYTPEAKERKVEGTVVLEVVVGKDGKARDLKVKKGLGFGLDESAIEKIKNEWLFTPGTLNGKAVNVRAFIEVSFRLY